MKSQNGITQEQIDKNEESKFNSQDKPLRLNLNHFYHSQPKKLVQEQLKYIATAIRAEKTLRDHMWHLNQHKKEMKLTMERSKIFS